MTKPNYKIAVPLATQKAREHVGEHNWKRMGPAEKNRYTQPYLQQAIDILENARKRRKE